MKRGVLKWKHSDSELTKQVLSSPNKVFSLISQPVALKIIQTC